MSDRVEVTCKEEEIHGMSCDEMYRCCDCGTDLESSTGCGCAYCWSCNACDSCKGGK
jgi:hypothetical protein